jgi:hypothetical protein
MELLGALGTVLALTKNLRNRLNGAAEAPYQAELAAIAGPKTETGYHLPVVIQFHWEPWGPHGSDSVMCIVGGNPVGYLDPRRVRSDGSLRLRLEVASLGGLPVTVEGYIVGGWSRDAGKDQGDYEIEFGLALGDDPLDSDMKELLEVED